MRVTRKVFSIYSEDKLISVVEEKAFCEGYQAAQREFAEEEEEKSRDHKRKIGVGLTGIGAVGGAVGVGKHLQYRYNVNKNLKSSIKKTSDNFDSQLEKYTRSANLEKEKEIAEHSRTVQEIKREWAEELAGTKNDIAKETDPRLKNWHTSRLAKIDKDNAKLLNRVDETHKETLRRLDRELEKAENEFGHNAKKNYINTLKQEASSNKLMDLKSKGLKYGLPALAVTGIGAGVMYKNRKNKNK